MPTSPVKVLLVEDNPADARLVELALARGKWAQYRIVSAKSLAEAVDFLRREPFDIILLDLSLPDSLGLQTLRALRQVQPPTIVLTGLCDEDTAKRSLDHGAQDYLVKGDSQIQDLERAILYAIGRHQFSSERIRRALRATKTATWTWCISDDSLVWDEGPPMLASAPDSLPIHHYADFVARVHPEDRPGFSQAVDQALKNGLPLDARFRIAAEDGNERHLALRGTVQRDSDGKPVGMVGVCWDVSEQQKMSDALRSSEARMKAILDAALDAVVTMNHEGRIIEINSAAERIFGYSREEVVGHLVGETIVSSNMRHAIEEEITRIMDRGESGPIGRRFEVTATRRDGREFPAELSLSVVHLDRQPPLFTTFICDITRRKEADAQLEKVWKTAQAANLAKSEFLARMSHELRTPLNGVIGMTELLLHTKLDAQQQHYAKIAKMSGDALLTLVNDVLDFSKIEAGKLELEVVDFNPGAVVESVAELLEHHATSKDLELTCHVEENVPDRLLGDPCRLHQVLTNLVNNALKFTERGEVAVKASLLETTDDGIVLRFSVRDTGAGIPSDQIENLFQSFSQVDSSMTRKYGGTGLGLAICKRLVELMGGQIGVDTGVSEGSTFWFTAKFGASRPQSSGHPSMKAIVGPEDRRVRVLVVDDNATNREILAHQLTSWGIELSAATDGAAGLEQMSQAVARGEPYDLAILDYQMPGMSGMDMARAVCARPELAGTALVLLTSAATANQPLWSVPACVRAVLTKPVRQSKLYETLVKLMERADALETPAAPERPAASMPNQPPARVVRPVLIAEDNAVNQAVLAGILDRAGIPYDAVEDGRRAVEAVLKREFSVVLMDCHMPQLDGFQATQQIREWEEKLKARDPSLRRLPIVAVTANAVQGDREVCLASGMDAYISKPLDPEKLLTIVESYLVPLEDAPKSEPIATPSAPAASNDMPELLRRWGGDRELVRRIVAKFLERLPKDLKELEDGVQAADSETVMRIAHGLKGAAGYLTADGVREVAARLEMMGRSGQWQGALEALAGLRDRAEQCKRELTSVLSIVNAKPSPAAMAGETSHAHSDRR